MYIYVYPSAQKEQPRGISDAKLEIQWGVHAGPSVESSGGHKTKSSGVGLKPNIITVWISQDIPIAAAEIMAKHWFHTTVFATMWLD